MTCDPEKEPAEGAEIEKENPGEKSRSSAGKIIKRVVYAVLGAILAFIVVCVGIALVERFAYHDKMPRVLGISMATVLTGSMEPEISAGDVIVNVKKKDYEVGDVITFYDDTLLDSDGYGSYVTHRIVAINSDGTYQTQGDANNASTSSEMHIEYDNVKGKVVLILRGWGNVMDFISSPVGIVCVVLVIAAIWLLAEGISLLVKRSKKGQGEDEDKQE